MTRRRPFDTISNDLVRRAVSGNGAALEKILAAAMGPFYNLALRMLQNHEDAEDATQEALIRVATKLSRFRGEAKFSTWAFTIATRCVFDFANGRAKHSSFGAKAFAADLAEGLSPSPRNDPDARLLAAQVKLGCCRAMLQVLGGDLRITYVLGEILGLEQADAARAIGISPATFRQRLARARARLRAVLRSSCGIASAKNQCRCALRVAPAKALGRLDPKDGDAGALDVKALSQRVQKLGEFAAAAAIFQADPQVSAAQRLLPRVREVFGMGK
jgi:RNA polymerase sigma factor (sigma-70 family)